MIERPSRTSGVGTAIVSVAAFLVLFHWLGEETWGHGRITIVRMIGAAAIVLAAPAIRRAEARLGTERMLAALVFVISGWLAIRLCRSLQLAVTHELAAGSGVDIARNVHAAGTHLLAGENPYATRAQLGHVVPPGPHVVVEDGVTRMYGLRYRYGFPYFPAMLAAYLPFRPLADSIHSIRIGNIVYLFLGAFGAAWLSARSVARGSRLLAASLAVLACLAIESLASEHVTLAVTDVCMSAVAAFAFVAASYGRPILTGVLLGVVQGAKLLPGPLVALPAIAAFGSRRDRAIAFGAYALTSSAIVLPALVPDWESFVSSTIAFYLTYHAEGDDTSLYWFLSPRLRPVFLAVGFALALFFALRGLRRRPETAALAARDAWLAYFLFTAFNKMTHLNYLWGVHALGAAAIASVAFAPRSTGARGVASSPRTNARPLEPGPQP